MSSNPPNFSNLKNKSKNLQHHTTYNLQHIKCGVATKVEISNFAPNPIPHSMKLPQLYPYFFTSFLSRMKCTKVK